MMTVTRFVLPMVLILLTGCKMVTKREFAVHSRRLSSLESDSRSLRSRVSTNSGAINETRTEMGALGTRLSKRDAELGKRVDDLCQVSKDEDQRLRAVISEEANDRKKSARQLSDAIALARGSETRLRRVVGELLQAEKELLVSLIEIVEIIEDMKKKGIITKKDILASKAVKLESAEFVKRIDSIKAQLEALTSPSKPKDRGTDR